MRKIVFFVLVFLVSSIIITPSAYGFFGIHKTCPRCSGIGRDPATLFLTSCPTCGGDGEVGVFMNDENLEDGLSFLGVGVIIIAIVVSAVKGIVVVAKETAKGK